MRNEIYFRRCGKVILTPGHNCDTETGQVEAIIQDAGHYGFSLSPNVLSCLTTKTKDELCRFRSRILELMQFVSRPAENRVIEAGSTEEFKRIFTSLMRSPSVFSEQDKQDIRWFIVHCLNYEEYVPPIIANPANRAVVAALLIQNNVLASMSVLYRHILSATDVLRIGCALSGANPALTDKIFFHSFSRKERAIMMDTAGVLRQGHAGDGAQAKRMEAVCQIHKPRGIFRALPLRGAVLPEFEKRNRHKSKHASVCCAITGH